jgi:hypothetical protein
VSLISDPKILAALSKLRGKPTVQAPFKSAEGKLVDLLADTGGSLSEVANGTVIRVGYSHAPWDMARPWKGPELTEYRKRYSAWAHAWSISFTAPMRPGTVTQFTLTLDKDLTPEEVDRSAAAYMTILNMRRE